MSVRSNIVFWHDQPTYENVASPESADVVVVGGGFSGVSTAIHLASRTPGKSVALVEAKFFGFGAGGRNAGLLSPLSAPVWLLTSDKRPSHRWALNAMFKESEKLSTWITEHAPDSGLAEGRLNFTTSSFIASRLLPTLSKALSNADIGHEPAFTNEVAGLTKLSLRASTVNPYSLTKGLIAHARRLGVRLYDRSTVTGISEDRGTVTVNLGGGRSIKCEAAVVCTNAYRHTNGLRFGRRGIPTSYFMLATSPLSEATIDRIGDPNDFTVSLGLKHLFFRLYKNRLLFGGTAKFGSIDETTITASTEAQLKLHLSRLVPAVADDPIESVWSGTVIHTANELPVIKRMHEGSRVFLNIGYGGTGVALSLICGRLCASLVLDDFDTNDRRLYEAIADTGIPLWDACRFLARALAGTH